MSNYVTLLGAEEVSSAGHRMSRAADEMRSAGDAHVSAMEVVLAEHRREQQVTMDKWLVDLREIMQGAKDVTQPAPKTELSRGVMATTVLAGVGMAFGAATAWGGGGWAFGAGLWLMLLPITLYAERRQP